MCTYTLQYPSNIEISNAVLMIQTPSIELGKYIMIPNDSRTNTYIWERNTMCVRFRICTFYTLPSPYSIQKSNCLFEPDIGITEFDSQG